MHNYSDIHLVTWRSACEDVCAWGSVGGGAFSALTHLSSQFSRTDVFDHAVVKPRFEILPIDVGKVLKSRFLCFFNLKNHKFVLC